MRRCCKAWALAGGALWRVRKACTDAAAPFVSAQQAERKPDRSDAIREYQQIIGTMSRRPSPQAWKAKMTAGLRPLRLRQLYEQLEQFAEAAQAYREVEALSHDPTKVARSLFRAAELFAERLGQIESAIALCQTIVRTHPA